MIVTTSNLFRINLTRYKRNAESGGIIRITDSRPGKPDMVMMSIDKYNSITSGKKPDLLSCEEIECAMNHPEPDLVFINRIRS